MKSEATAPAATKSTSKSKDLDPLLVGFGVSDGKGSVTSMGEGVGPGSLEAGATLPRFSGTGSLQYSDWYILIG